MEDGNKPPTQEEQGGGRASRGLSTATTASVTSTSMGEAEEEAPPAPEQQPAHGGSAAAAAAIAEEIEGYQKRFQSRARQQKVDRGMELALRPRNRDGKLSLSFQEARGARQERRTMEKGQESTSKGMGYEEEEAPPEEKKGKEAAAPRPDQEEDGGGGAAERDKSSTSTAMGKAEEEAPSALDQKPVHGGSAGAAAAIAEEIEAHRRRFRSWVRKDFDQGREFELRPRNSDGKLSLSFHLAAAAAAIGCAVQPPPPPSSRALPSHGSAPAPGSTGGGASSSSPAAASSSSGAASWTGVVALPDAKPPSYKQKRAELLVAIHPHLAPAPLKLSDDSNFMLIAIKIQQLRGTAINLANLTGKAALIRVLPPGTNLGVGNLGLYRASLSCLESLQQQQQ